MYWVSFLVGGYTAAGFLVLSGNPVFAPLTCSRCTKKDRLGTFASLLWSNESVNATRRSTVAMVVGVAVLAGVAAYLRFWRVSSIDASALWPRPPRASEPPPLLDGTPYDVPCPSAQERDVWPIETALCEVVSHPQNFLCRRIRFRSTLLNDCMHSNALIDDRCERGIVPMDAPNADPAVGTFFAGACAGRPINFDVKRTATFTGRFRLRLRDDRTIYTVGVEAVESVKITPRPRVTGSEVPR